MKILAIETSSKVCAVALFEDNKLIKEKIIEDENTHSVKLMPLIDELLKETNIDLNNIDLFSCDKGPGSFTGIRIGIATIKAFIDVTNKNSIGITSLEALTYNVEEDGIICSMIDAKNENVYYGFFKKEYNKVEKLDELKFGNINDVFKEIIDNYDKIIFIGNASKEYKNIIEENLKQKAIFIEDIEKNKLNARNIALAAFNNRKEAGDTNLLLPVYLRKSNAERMLEGNK